MHDTYAANGPPVTTPLNVFSLYMHAHLETYKVKKIIVFIFILQVLQYALLLFQPLNSYTPSSSTLNTFDAHAHALTLNAPALPSATKLDKPASTLDLFIRKLEVPALLPDIAPTLLDGPELCATTLITPAPTMLNAPTIRFATLDTQADPVYLINSDSTRPRNLGYIALGPSNPHDPGPTAAVASRIAAQNDIIAHNMSPFIHFTIYDRLRIPPRSPQ